MEDNNKDTNVLSFDLQEIISEVNKPKEEALAALDKIYVPAEDFEMRPSETIEKPEEAPGLAMTPSEQRDPARTLEEDFKSIDITPMEHTSDAYDRACDEAAGIKASAPKKEKKYVTVGTLIGCMLLTLLLSTLLESVLGGGISKLINTNNFDVEREERDDSELSQLNLSDATGSELTVSQIADKAGDAVVEIVVSGTAQGMWGQMQLTQGAGSGVVVRPDGYIATNYHVIQGANKMEVTLRNGEVYPARIVGSDPSNDVAVIKIEENNLPTAVIGDSSTVAVGDLAVAIGNPLGQLGGSVTTGIISALDRTLSVEGTTLTLIQTDAAINGGNSGGGLFNSRGELIGIVESKASAVGVEGLAFALPINTVASIINDLIEGGSVYAGQGSGIPAVGVGILEVSDDEAQYYGLLESGVYIKQVTGTNAVKAGFKEGDRIVSFNGIEVRGSDEFIYMVRDCKIGDTVTIVVSRDGREIEIKTVLEELQTYQ